MLYYNQIYTNQNTQIPNTLQDILAFLAFVSTSIFQTFQRKKIIETIDITKPKSGIIIIFVSS